eukprot:12410521-Karenia_brevis.AAC.1
MAYQPHTQQCRERFSEILKDSAKVRNQKARMDEFKERETRKVEEQKEAEGQNRGEQINVDDKGTKQKKENDDGRKNDDGLSK